MKVKAKRGRRKLPDGKKRMSIRCFPKKEDVEKCGGEKQAEQIALYSIENFKQNVSTTKK